MADFGETLAKVRAQLAARGARSISGLSRTFRQLDSYDGNKKVDAEELYIGLNEAGCELSKDEIACLMEKFDEDCSGNLTFDEFLKGIRGDLNEARQAIVDQAYAKFDSDGSGEISMSDLQGVYNVEQHPKFQSGEMTQEEIFMEFLGAFGDADASGTISHEEWNDYYRGISSSFDTDEQFIQSMTNAW